MSQSRVMETPPVWTRAVRFIADDGLEYCGEPEDPDVDVGLALAEGQSLCVKILSTKSILDTDVQFTGKTKVIKKLLCPVATNEIGTIRCIGLNYTDHAAEMGLDLPSIPEMFMKPATCALNPTDTISIPSIVTKADPEVELAVIIGKDCKNVSVDSALEYALGYTVANDLTARCLQGKVSQWGYCKGFDGFCPLGPAIVSAKEIPNPSVLSLKTVLDGATMQESTTANLIFSVPEIISYLSQGTTLTKGTVILTGTPAGIGHGRDPPIYLSDTSTLRVSISHGLGTLTNGIRCEK
ncbi:fumarylacetoacetate hydrolase family protein [Aspergillus stella-maris]|uniref:fumarylacetoacetate hydrolase family protein n=1 Tax=Aspergillus stella-maris TaxID=1810926 RepID=UPI003CCE51DF